MFGVIFLKLRYILAALLLIQGCGGDAANMKSKQQTRTPALNINEKDDGNSLRRAFENGQSIGKSDKKMPEQAMLDVPLIKQNPELKYGCEVTSLAMVLNYAGVDVNKMELYREIRKDSDPLFRQRGNIKKWGDPATGFVGDMTGSNPGYAVFDKPIVDLMDKYLPGRAVNLTGQEFNNVLAHVAEGYPAVVWTTGDYRLPDRWESWLHGKRTISTPLDLHAVALVGYDRGNVYINDPLSGKKQLGVDKEQFIRSWRALKSRAVSYN